MKALIVTDFHRGFNKNVSLIQDKAYSKIDPNSFDLIIVSGDWGTSSIDHVKGAFRFFRKTFPNKIICGVLGNHDLWDKKLDGLNNRINRINAYAKESNIHLLENNPLEINDYTIFGYNGWFSSYDYENCNDINYMRGQITNRDLIADKAEDIFAYKRTHNSQNKAMFDEWCKILLDREQKAIDGILSSKTNNKKIVITHMPIFERYFEENPMWAGKKENGDKLLPFFDFHIFGHTHNRIVEVEDSKTFINAGAVYGKALYLIYDFDLNKVISSESN